jgi:hypothetical protein
VKSFSLSQWLITLTNEGKDLICLLRRKNDEIDRWRAAVALAHSDLFITDPYMADLCRRAKVADYGPTNVRAILRSLAMQSIMLPSTSQDKVEKIDGYSLPFMAAKRIRQARELRSQKARDKQERL